LDKSFYGDRQTDDTEAKVRPLYLFITIVIIKEGRTKKGMMRGEKEERRDRKKD
jgi:hypothetical protein